MLHGRYSQSVEMILTIRSFVESFQKNRKSYEYEGKAKLSYRNQDLSQPKEMQFLLVLAIAPQTSYRPNRLFYQSV